ncbi:membrane protein [Vibrio phage D181]
MVIDKSSWHYKLNAFRTSAWRVNRVADSCSYKAMTIKSILLVSIYTAILTLACFLMGLGVLGEETTQHPMVILGTGVFMLVVMVLICFGVVVIFAYLNEKYTARKYRLKAARVGGMEPPKEPGFFTTWYDQAKNKYCTPLKFKG